MRMEEQKEEEKNKKKKKEKSREIMIALVKCKNVIIHKNKRIVKQKIHTRRTHLVPFITNLLLT